MKREMLFLPLLLLFLLSILSQALTVNAEVYRAKVTVNDVSWGGNVDPSPGDRNLELRVTLMLTSSLPISRIRATLELPEGFTGPMDTPYSNATFPSTVNPNTEFTLKFKVNIGDDVSIGLYNATLKLNYYLVYGKWLEEGEEIALNIPIKVLGRPEIKVTLSPKKLTPATMNNVTLVIKNEGTGEAKDLSVALLLQNMIIVNNESTYHFELLKPSEEKEIHLQMYVNHNVQEKIISIPIIVTYISPYGVVRTEQYTIDTIVTSLPKRDFELGANTTNVKEREDNHIKLQLKYIGVTRIYNVTISTSVNNGIIIREKTPTYILSKLNPDEVVDIPLTVYVFQNTKTLTINVYIKYHDEIGIEYTATTNLVLKVVREVESEGSIMVYANTSELMEGEINNIQLIIINTYKYTIYDVILSTSVSQSFTILGNRTFYIESLNQNEKAVINLKVNVPYGVLGSTGYLTINVIYKDISGSLENKAFYIGFIVKTRKVAGGKLVIQAITTNVTAGVINSIHVILRNIGNEKLRNIKVQAQSPQYVIIGNSELIIDQLEPGEKRDLSFTIYVPVNAAGSSGKITLNIQYETLYSQFSDTATIGFYVSRIAKYSRIIVEASPLYLTANTMNTVNITLVNTGKTMSNVKMMLSGSQGLQIFGRRVYSFSTINSNEEKQIKVELYPMANIVNTVAYLTLQITYEDIVEGKSYTETHYLGFYVQNITLREPRVVVEILNSTLYSKKTNTVYLLIRNIGLEEAYDIRVDIQTPTTITIIKPSSHIEIDKISAGKSIIEKLMLYVGNVQSRSVGKITITVRYSDISGQERSMSIQKGLIVEPYITVSPVSIYVDTPDLYGGLLNNITLFIENNGDEDLLDVQVIITTPQQVSLMGIDNRFYIAVLKAKEKIPIKLALYAAQQAIGQASKLTITISYADRYGDVYTENRIIGLSIRGRIDLKLTGITITPTPVAPGSTLTISGLIINTGTTTAKSVTLSILRKTPFEPIAILGGTVVGDIPSGVQLPFTLSCNIAEDAKEGRYTIQIVIEYIDDRGMPVKKTEQLPVVISSHTMPSKTKSVQSKPAIEFIPYSSNLFYLGLGVLIGLVVMVPVVLKIKKSTSEE